MDGVNDIVNGTVEGSNIDQVITIVKEGMSSKELSLNARNFPYLKQLVNKNAMMYTNLKEPFDSDKFS